MATNPEERPEERQRRELEGIRRKFTGVGARLVPAFEPAPPAELEQQRALPPAPPPDRPARPGWQWLAAAALLFVLGTGLGYLLPPSGGSAQPAPPPQPSVTTPAAPRTSTAPRPSAVVPRVCLETARRADEVIALLNRNIRTRRLAEALKAYTLASQACRQEASP